MKVSIITVCYNSSATIRDSIESVLSQSYSNIEYIIIDGASKDNTLSIVNEYKDRITTVISEPDTGIYDAMNKGVAMSKGAWLYFLGADDALYDSNTLSEVSEQLKDEFEAVSGKIVYDFQKADTLFVKSNKGEFTSTWSSMLWIKNTVHHQSVFYNRSVFIEKKFLLRYTILADYAFNLSLFVQGSNVKSISNKIAICKTRGVSKHYNWALYKEEIKLKTQLTSKILQPLFFKIAFLKFLLKKFI